jgi:hypothetical protein
MTSLQRRIRKLEAPLAVNEVAEPSWAPLFANANGAGQKRKGGPTWSPCENPRR